jgi:tRNA-dihydrouridine synthase C
MIGRGAIRNPWIFSQLRASLTGTTAPQPSHRDLLGYITELYDEVARETKRLIPGAHVQRMKRHLAYITHGLDGSFEFEIRRAKTQDGFFEICRHHLDHVTPLPKLPPRDSKLFCGFSALLPEISCPASTHRAVPAVAQR